MNKNTSLPIRDLFIEAKGCLDVEIAPYQKAGLPGIFITRQAPITGLRLFNTLAKTQLIGRLWGLSGDLKPYRSLPGNSSITSVTAIHVILDS